MFAYLELSVYFMMTSSNGNIFRVTGPLCGEFTGPGDFPTQRPVTRSFDVFFDLCLNKRLRNQPWGWWFETPSWPLWRQCNAGYFREPHWFSMWLLEIFRVTLTDMLTYTTFLGLDIIRVTPTGNFVTWGPFRRMTCLEVVARGHSVAHCKKQYDTSIKSSGQMTCTFWRNGGVILRRHVSAGSHTGQGLFD